MKLFYTLLKISLLHSLSSTCVSLPLRLFSCPPFVSRFRSVSSGRLWSGNARADRRRRSAAPATRWLEGTGRDDAPPPPTAAERSTLPCRPTTIRQEESDADEQGEERSSTRERVSTWEGKRRVWGDMQRHLRRTPIEPRSQSPSASHSAPETPGPSEKEGRPHPSAHACTCSLTTCLSSPPASGRACLFVVQSGQRAARFRSRTRSPAPGRSPSGTKKEKREARSAHHT